MERLLTDAVTRRLCQFAIYLLFAGLAVVAIATLLVSYARVAGFVSSPATTAMAALLAILALPLKDAYGQFLTIFVSVFPQIVAAVCFEVDPGPPAKQSTRRNLAGTMAMLCLIAGVVCWALVLGVFLFRPRLFGELVSDNDFLLAKATVSGLVSFQFIYLVRLLGLENLQ